LLLGPLEAVEIGVHQTCELVPCRRELTGASLLDRMEGVETVSQVHSNESYSVLAHGIQDDPVYCYFNAGAFLTYGYPPEEIYELPSRYSAPDGPVRADRQVKMQTVVAEGVWTFPTAIRQAKSGHQFQLQDVVLWNVYTDDGVRVGQTALFDRDRILPVPQHSNVNANGIGNDV
jgi:hypothetical protein